MLNQEILSAIECAIPHKCERETNRSNKCAHCDIGYKFISIEPVTLKCSHHICKECESRVEKDGMNCNLCNKKSELSGASGAAAEIVVQAYLNPLFDELKEKYKMTFNIYDGTLKLI